MFHVLDVSEDRCVHITVRCSSAAIVNVSRHVGKSDLSRRSELNNEACHVNVALFWCVSIDPGYVHTYSIDSTSRQNFCISVKSVSLHSIISN